MNVFSPSLSHSSSLFFLSDNPLECTCDLRWYRDWRQRLRDADDDINNKKRTVCTMPHEHREYSLQNMPLEMMNCVGKNLGQTSSKSSGAVTTKTSSSSVSTAALFFFSFAVSAGVCHY